MVQVVSLATAMVEVLHFYMLNSFGKQNQYHTVLVVLVVVAKKAKKPPYHASLKPPNKTRQQKIRSYSGRKETKLRENLFIFLPIEWKFSSAMLQRPRLTSKKCVVSHV